jgi:alkylation response protein AidB-like acyl-CoA dehydrogenase
VRFALTEDQVALRDAVRDVLAGPQDGLWAALVRLGVIGAAAPVEHGGLGLDDTDLVPLLEELGYAAVPLPVAETASVAVPLLAAAGDPALLGVLAGETRVAIAGPGGLTPYARRADLVLHLDGGAARLSSPHGAEPVSTMDGSLAAAVVPAPAGGLVTDDPRLVRLAAARATVATAAQLVGLGRRMLDMTLVHVRQRHQFGVPVGSFQAVKHRLADVALCLEFAAPAVLAAGWALAHDTADADRDVAAAAVLAADAAHATSRAAIQCHGAIGYTVEYDLHRYAKRTWALVALADPGAHLDRLAEALELKEHAR